MENHTTHKTKNKRSKLNEDCNFCEQTNEASKITTDERDFADEGFRGQLCSDDNGVHGGSGSHDEGNHRLQSSQMHAVACHPGQVGHSAAKRLPWPGSQSPPIGRQALVDHVSKLLRPCFHHLEQVVVEVVHFGQELPRFCVVLAVAVGSCFRWPWRRLGHRAEHALC